MYVRRSTTGAQTLSSYARPQSLEPTRVAAEPMRDVSHRDAKRVDSFPLLSTLADKALAMGRPEDAERILSSLMLEVLNNAQRGDVLPNETVDQAAQYGVRLANATGRGSWVDYVVTLYAAVRRPCPATIVDELHSVVRKTSAVDLSGLRAYVEMLRASAAGFGPADRFLVQRIEGLERLVASK
jgi:hypothetical protein